MKKLILVASIALFSSHSHAGIFDVISGWFGGDEEKIAEQPATPSAATASPESSMVSVGLQLLPMLMQQLNISESQASGGMGALLQAASSLLSGDDSKTLMSAIPNASSLLGMAPKVPEGKAEGDLLSSALKAAEDSSKTVKMANQLTSQFKSLGMGANMIPGFVETAKNYLANSGNEEAGTLLTSALSSFL